MSHPSQVTVGPDEYLKWCARSKTDEVTILSVVVVRGATYRLTLLWPDTPKPVQKDLFAP
jgi:hypothetical protein